MNPKAKKKKVFHIPDIKSVWYFVSYLSQPGDFLIIACTSKTENQIHKEGPPAEIGLLEIEIEIEVGEKNSPLTKLSTRSHSSFFSGIPF